MSPIRLHSYQREDLDAIRQMEPSLIQKVKDSIHKLKVSPMLPADLVKAVEHAIGNEEAAVRLTREAVVIYGLCRDSDIPPEEWPSAIRDTIDAEFEWSDEEKRQWDVAGRIFLEILTLPAIRMVDRTVDLSYEFPNIWRGARIITDIRPIFDEEAKEIQGAVVAHTFRLRYASSDGRHELSISLDETDIDRLVLQAERALRKSQVAKRLMDGRAGVPTLISGEEDV